MTEESSFRAASIIRFFEHSPRLGLHRTLTPRLAMTVKRRLAWLACVRPIGLPADPRRPEKSGLEATLALPLGTPAERQGQGQSGANQPEGGRRQPGGTHQDRQDHVGPQPWRDSPLDV